MGRDPQPKAKKPPVTFEPLPGAEGATGLFGLEDEAEEVAGVHRSANIYEYILPSLSELDLSCPKSPGDKPWIVRHVVYNPRAPGALRLYTTNTALSGV